jgi:hypothetical protein
MSLELPDPYVELAGTGPADLKEFAAQMQRNLEKIARAIVLPNRLILTGPGDPTGVVRGSPPMVWLRTDGGPGTTLYVKESGVDDTAGWNAK